MCNFDIPDIHKQMNGRYNTEKDLENLFKDKM